MDLPVTTALKPPLLGCNLADTDFPQAVNNKNVAKHIKMVDRRRTLLTPQSIIGLTI
ncbi:hypothetical protein LFUMFP_20016 [Latilactobacillus fuchuensis]|uniref:Uncharacterized protein n=1 Tax=Latilactobacillus fuchuensis TaxID=164393 RepID=A0A2N9DUG6_9LACO|nr:hypothetical protein LFUMFP_20016 [Latilactobacillus fuchuensis]